MGRVLAQDGVGLFHSEALSIRQCELCTVEARGRRVVAPVGHLRCLSFRPAQNFQSVVVSFTLEGPTPSDHAVVSGCNQDEATVNKSQHPTVEGINLLCLLFIHPPAHGSEVSPAARNTLDSARIPRASKLLIYGLFRKGRVLAQDAVES